MLDDWLLFFAHGAVIGTAWLLVSLLWVWALDRSSYALGLTCTIASYALHRWWLRCLMTNGAAKPTGCLACGRNCDHSTPREDNP
jgi:hypothetical protein